MSPEKHLSKVLTVYHTVLRDLEGGNNTARHIPQLESVINELDGFIMQVAESGGRTKGYCAIKTEMIDLKNRIKMASK